MSEIKDKRKNILLITIAFTSVNQHNERAYMTTKLTLHSLPCDEIYVLTSIKIPRSTTKLVTYPRTRPMTLLATDDDPISTSIYKTGIRSLLPEEKLPDLISNFFKRAKRYRIC